MTSVLSTGSRELDNCLEELRAGDNVVFYTSGVEDYLPFVTSLVAFIRDHFSSLVYVRTDGLFDDHVAPIDGAEILEVVDLASRGETLAGLEREIKRLGPRDYYLFEPLLSLAPWIGTEEAVRRAFLTLCPLLFDLDAVAYWDLTTGVYGSSTIAAIKDCTQVFIKVDRADLDMMITPLKVWGRYSDAMLQPHRVAVVADEIRIQPLPIDAEYQQSYTQALAEKNRELAEIRDALNRSNIALRQRNEQLADLNARLSEQSRLYQSLRVNLDHLLALFRAGQDIASSLVVSQVRQAIVTATLRLFEDSCCRLYLMGDAGEDAVDHTGGVFSPQALSMSETGLDDVRGRACESLTVQSLTRTDPVSQESISAAVAPILVRSVCLGTLEVYSADPHLDSAEARTLLGFLCSEASIALDNAHLYREVEIQGEQLRSYVENVITSVEQEGRRLAFDLHDGLVQIIVAAYQHLQTAQAWRGRDPVIEAQEIAQGVQILRQAIYEARRLISRLRPAGLDDLGLVHALRIYIAQLVSDAEWEVALDIDPSWSELPSALEAAIFRIVQEATTNAQKYAAAERVQIELTVHEDRLRVTVRDTGKGFDPATVASVPEQGLHMGLIGIRERTRQWGGRCEIQSRPGRGTSIIVEIPKARALAVAEGSL